MKSYLEKKERRRRLFRETIFLVFVLFIINLFLWRMYNFFLARVAFGILDIVSILFYLKYTIGIKIPERKLQTEVARQLDELKNYYYTAHRQKLNDELLSIEKENETCPKCFNNKKNLIVDKIRRVKGEVDGEFFLGFGSVGGEIDTESVNYCNKCGHEWKKEEISYSNIRESAMNQILEPMYYFFNNNQDNTLDELKKFSARAIKIFIKKHEDGYRAEELKKLSERDLKKYGCS